MSEQNEPVDPGKPPVKDPRWGWKRFTFYAVLGLTLGIVLFVSALGGFGGKSSEEINLTQASDKISAGQIEKAQLNQGNNTVELTAKDGTVFIAAYPVTSEKELTQLMIEKKVQVTTDPTKPPSILTNMMLTLLPVGLIILFLVWFSRKGSGGMMGLGKFGSKKTSPVEIPDTRFSDVAGLDEAVEELQEVVTFFSKPETFTRVGARVPKGILLVGPPGTGKTLLARAVAGEAGVSFFSISGSDFVEMFVGLGASRVRQLFDKAREADKAIIFIDEIDAIGRSRASGASNGGSDERENTLNQLLVELDGFNKSNVVIIAASNRPDILDPALVRPGRFDRRVVVPSPDMVGRERILKLHAKNKPIAEDVNWESLSRRTVGMSGADLEALLNEAAMVAAKREGEEVSEKDIEIALHTSVLGRERRSAVVTDRDREIVAWHESGHTLAALKLEDAMDPVTVSVVPRGPAGGVTWMDGSEHEFTTKNQLLAQLTVAMSGRAAEEILLDGDYTQGAAGDLQSATSIATLMVTRWGMGRLMISRDEALLKSAEDSIDNEVAEIIQEALVRARIVTLENRALLEALALELLDKETLNLKQIKELVERLSISRKETV